MGPRGDRAGRMVAAVIVASLLLPAVLTSLPAAAESASQEERFGGTVHPMTTVEVEKLKMAWGVRDPTTDYNTLLFGRGTGYAPPTEEQYAAMVGSVMVMDAPPLAATEAAWDLSDDPFFPAVGDQGNVGSCAAWAMAYYCYGYLEAKDNNWTEAGLGTPSQLISPSWCYNKVNGGADTGTWMGEVGSVLTTWGGATLATMPYVGTGTSPSRYLDWGGEAAFREAPLHRARSVVSLDLGQSWPATLSSIRSVLTSGTPVTFALDASVLDPARPGDGVITSDEYVYSRLNHAQTIVGYDDGKVSAGEVGAFKVVNSWGDDFWGSGYYWITYKGFQKLLSSNAGNQLVYVTDRVDYAPSLLGVWHYSTPPKKDIASSITVTTVCGTGSVRPYYTASSYSFPYYMCLDLSDLQADYDRGCRTFELTASSSANGTLSSFRTELYAGGYAPGIPAWVSGQSPEAPVMGTSIRATSLLPPWPSVSMAQALDLGSANLSTGGEAGWAPTEDSVWGGSSVRSGDVAASSTSWLKLRLGGSGVLGFDWRMEASPYLDDLTLFVNGSAWGGLENTTSWAHVEIPIQGSETELVWSYSRQGYGGGCAYIDNLTWSYRDLRVDGDEDLRRIASLMGWPGTGLEGDPYVIDSYTPDRSSTPFGLYIGNTTLWLKVVNGRFSGMDQAGEAGLYLFNAEDIVVTDSMFTGNEYGVVIDQCSNVFLDSVSITASGSSAVRMMESTEVFITGCNISENAEGLWLSESRGTVSNNLFYHNTGLAVRSLNSPGSTFYANAFIGNNGTTAGYDPARPQAYDDSVSAWHLGIGNYWSDLTGPDVDGDGIIDGASYPLGVTADGLPVASVVSAPTSLQAERQGTNVQLRWSPPERAFFVQIAGYEVTCWSAEGMITFKTNGLAFLDDRSKEWGEYTYAIRAVTWLEHGPASLPIVVLIPDTTAPSVAILSPREGTWFGKPTISVSWTSDDGQSGMDHHEISQDGGAFKDMGLGTFTTLLFSSNGQHRIIVRAFDQAGNSAEDVVTINIDLSPPTIVVNAPTARAMLTTSTVTISLTVTDPGSGYHRDSVRVDGNTVWKSDNVSPILLTVELGDGVHQLAVTSTDRVGNTVTTTVQFTVDTTPPTLMVIDPAEETICNTTTIVISWTADDAAGLTGIEVRVDGGGWTMLGAEERSYATGALSEGEHRVDVRAIDRAGHVNETSVLFVVDTVAVEAWLEHDTDLLLSGPLEVRFSKPIVPDTLQLSLPFIAEVSGGDVLTIVPAERLEAGRQYTIMVRASGLNGLNSGWLELTFTTADHVTVSGTIIDGSGAPIEEALIIASDGTFAITDQDGCFSMQLPYGPVNLTVRKEGYADSSWSVVVGSGETSSIGTKELQAAGLAPTFVILAAVLTIAAISAAMLMVRGMKR